MTLFDQWVNVINSITLEQMIEARENIIIPTYAYPREGLSFYTFPNRFEMLHGGLKLLTIYVDTTQGLQLSEDLRLSGAVDTSVYDEFIGFIDYDQ